MNPEPSFAEIEELFHRVMQAPETQRTATIEQHTSGNPALRKEVLSLVQAVSAADRLLTGGSPQAPLSDPQTRIGSRIDSYLLDRLLGRGGMGEVYAGHRVDGDIEQSVAIKVIDATLDSAVLRNLFFRERDALARLHHPHVARLLDGGVTEQNSPYLVMEIVGDEVSPALQLDRFCENRKLSVRSRVAMVIEVCEAVNYAHRNLIVHGDLKPANVLVTARGDVKLLDFGAARLLAGDETGSRPAAFTPAYASPEQALGKPLTVASDVYSAGKLLDRVLAGLLNAELGAIVAKATRQMAEERYPSMAMLAGDLRNWLGRRPLSVYSTNRSYVARKWLSRNRRLVLAVSVVLTALAACIVQTQRSAHKANAERERAIRAAQDVEVLAHRLLFDFQVQLKDIGSSTEAQHQLADTTLNYLNELSSDPSVTSDALRLDMANAYARMGALLGDPYDENLGQPKEAEAALQKAIGTASQLLRENPAGKDARFSLAQAESYLADVEFGEGNAKAARDEMTESVNNLKVLARAPDASLLVLLETASNEGSLGDIYGLPGNNSLDQAGEAVKWYREGISMEERVLKIDPANGKARRGVAVEEYKIANLTVDKDPGTAIAGYGRALAGIAMLPDRVRLAAPTVRLQFLIGTHMGRAYVAKGDFKEALVSMTRAHDYAAKQVERDPLDDRARYDLATMDRTLGETLLACGERDKARAAFQESARNFDFMLQRNPGDADVKSHRQEIVESLKKLDRGANAAKTAAHQVTLIKTAKSAVPQQQQ